MSRDFSIDEWLKWSKLNIHYYCTTSLEASAMGVENLAFNPDINEKYFRTIPYLFSHKINSLNKIEQFINKVLKKKIKTKKNKNIEQYIYNFYSKDSYVKIISEIKNLSKTLDTKENRFQSRINIFNKKLLNFKFMLKKFGSYTDYKSPNLLYSQLENDLLKFRKRGMKKIKIAKFQKNVFEISV